MSATPREVAEQVRRMVAGDGVVFADLFAEDGVLKYPFAIPGQPPELRGRAAIREFFGGLEQARELLDMADAPTAVIRETDDPEVVVAEIRHHGWSRAGAGTVIRVRDGEIVAYDDYMDPIATAGMLGRTADLAATLTAS
jgi:ketosteroid isomerase-like protein